MASRRRDSGRDGALSLGAVHAAAAAGARLRAGSFIVTVFGDAVAPRGGRVALAGLIELLAALGINDSQVRTAISRLVADGWLVAARRGRVSFYGLSAEGLRRTRDAARRIYGGPAAGWDGSWTVVLPAPAGPDGADLAGREALRRELAWQGFGLLPGGGMVHPAPDRAALRAAVAASAPSRRPLVLAGAPGADLAAGRRITAAAWDLDALAADYRAFAQLFRPFLGPAARADADPMAALALRLVLVHAWRRIVLRDPMLPPQLLPRSWAGAQARRLAGRLYRSLLRASESWIDGHLRAQDGSLPRPGRALAARFGGARR